MENNPPKDDIPPEFMNELRELLSKYKIDIVPILNITHKCIVPLVTFVKNDGFSGLINKEVN